MLRVELVGINLDEINRGINIIGFIGPRVWFRVISHNVMVVYIMTMRSRFMTGASGLKLSIICRRGREE